MNNYKFKIALICFSLFLFSAKHPDQKNTSVRVEKLQLIMDMDGPKILSSIDNITTNQVGTLNLNLSFLGFGKKHHLEIPLDKVSSINPQLASLWNSTAMVFGAAATGVGIGTTFAIKKADDGRMLFMTNFHVVEQFCNIPEEINSDLVQGDDLKYPCQALFVLHDLSINTLTNSASIDGSHPWKSEVLSLDYFDKQRDLAVFRINLPDDSDINPTSIEKNYDIKTLLISEDQVEKRDSKLLSVIVNGVNMSPVTAFPIYLIAISMPNQKTKKTTDLIWIKKQCFQGTIKGTQTFENDKKLGFISALKHDIEVLPGSSGGPLALSDGRVVGINASVEIKQFYARAGWLRWMKYKLETLN
jgi:hypothetical protein